jgi:hypothetical protein
MINFVRIFKLLGRVRWAGHVMRNEMSKKNADCKAGWRVKQERRTGE